MGIGKYLNNISLVKLCIFSLKQLEEVQISQEKLDKTRKLIFFAISLTEPESNISKIFHLLLLKINK